MSVTVRSLSQKGFTLLEILVVLVILGLLSGLVGPRLLGHLDSSKVTAASLQIDEFGAALDMVSAGGWQLPKVRAQSGCAH